MDSVLVVDDEQEICILLGSMMKKLGFKPDFANTLEQSKKKLANEAYDIVFLDLNLPDGLGFHLIENVEANNPKAKIIIISAYDGNIERQRAKEEGADYFIPKPFSKQSVIDALDHLQIPFTA